MPKKNFTNIGELQGYEYLKGVISSVDESSDTCTVAINGVDFSTVPIYYHCAEDSAEREDNGAIEGAAAGFAEDDEVIVLKQREGLDDKIFVIGHIDGPRHCEGVVLLIELDGEFLIWNTASGLVLLDGDGNPIEYPLTSGNVDAVITSLGITLETALSVSDDADFDTPSYTEPELVENCSTVSTWCNVAGKYLPVGSCNNVGMNEFGTQTEIISYSLIFEEYPGGVDCLGLKTSTEYSKDYSDTEAADIPGTDDQFDNAIGFTWEYKTVYNDYTPVSVGPKTAALQNILIENFNTASLSETVDANLQSAFFWRKDNFSLYEELDTSFNATVHIVTGQSDYYYKSYINDNFNIVDPIITRNGVQYSVGGFYWPANVNDVDIVDNALKTGLYEKFAVVLEQPIITFTEYVQDYVEDTDPYTIHYKWEIIEHWEQSQIYVQIDAVLSDPEDPTSSYVYDWDKIVKLNMESIFENFTKTLAEDVEENGVDGGLNIKIYKPII